jgi:glycosyltransferase involved in cell wall biosynthesis
MQESPPNGVGRVTGQVLPHLVDRVDFTLLTQTERPPLDLGLPEHALRTPWPGLAAGWLQIPAARWLRGFDGIFHCPWYALPFVQHVPSVVTLHDLTFERHPEWFEFGRRTSYVVQARWAARTARAILTPSRTVADDVIATYGVPAERVIAAMPAVDAVFGPDRDPSDLLHRLGISTPYVVALGGSRRRNLDVAVATWHALRERYPIELVVAGSEQLPPQPGLHVSRFGDEDWAALLAGASALLYPTAYEGFGLPAAEAIASGTPVVCAPVGSLREVLEDAAAWCEAPTVPEMVAATEKLLSSPALAADLSAASLRRAAELPTCAQAAEHYLAAYLLAAK